MNIEMGEKRLPENQGVIFLIHKNGMVLLERRTNPDMACFGYTIIPGGKFEKKKDKDHEYAVRREIKEECGDIKIKKMVFLGKYLSNTITNQLYNFSAFLITEFEGEISNPENKSEHVWVEIDQADKLLEFADSKYIILMAKNYLLRKDSQGV